MKRRVWREPDPIATVMQQTGMTRLQVLEGIQKAMLERHAAELKRNPKAPQALQNLQRAIDAERSRK